MRYFVVDAVVSSIRVATLVSVSIVSGVVVVPEPIKVEALVRTELTNNIPTSKPVAAPTRLRINAGDVSIPFH